MDERGDSHAQIRRESWSQYGRLYFVPCRASRGIGCGGRGGWRGLVHAPNQRAISRPDALSRAPRQARRRTASLVARIGALRSVLISWIAMAGQLDLALRGHGTGLSSVADLVRMVRDALDIGLNECWVVGEVSNARVAPSNHFYFTLKDERSAINVVMFKTAFNRMRFKVSDGMEVIVRGRVQVFEQRGALQLYAEEMEPRGVGALQVAFEQLKRRLDAEGLFDRARKRASPYLPRTVGIVTAVGGAGLAHLVRNLVR